LKIPIVLLSVLCVHLQAAGPVDAKAREIAQAMMKEMGGQDAWNQAHFVRYDFRVTAGGKTVADRSHLWDKRTGRYRLESVDKSGARQVVLFNTADAQGSSKPEVKQAYATFINDMYWLAMPWKWMDAGVHLKYVGVKGGFDVVQLTFDHVGLTPGDRYDAYVSPKSHLMEHWEYTLQSGNKGSWDWEYTTTAGVKLAKNHTSKDGKSINMGEVRIMNSVDDAYFTDQSRSLASLK
jgi:hypothetical protein